jgi:hypothetical protein
MVIIDETIYFSSVQEIVPTKTNLKITDGSDRASDKGVGYLFKTDLQGNLIERITLGENNIYHPGGIDYDGKYIWVPVSEYRPHSSSIIYRVDPSSMKATEIFRFKDHITAVVYSTIDSTLHGMNWDSRMFYAWKLNKQLKPIVTEFSLKKIGKPNSSHYINYQDCHFLKSSYMLCGGVNKYKIPILGEFAFGGLELVDLRTQMAIHQIPVSQWVKPTLAMTHNPFYYELKEDHLRFYFMPEDDESIVYIFDTFY